MKKRWPALMGMLIAASAAAQPIDPTEFLGSPFETECNANLLLCGQTAVSNLTTEDCALSSGAFFDIWFMPLQVRQGIGLAVASTDFDTYLTLFDPLLRVAAANDDRSGTTDSAVGGTVYRSGIWSGVVGTPPGAPPDTGRYAIALVCSGACIPDGNTLCLNNRRFRVQLSWRNQFNGQVGFGRAIPRSGVSGFFSFGDPSNIELMVKILNFGNTFKVFYGQLTNLNFNMQVTDTLTGRSKTYSNTRGDCGAIDGEGFPSASRAAEPDLATSPATAACRSSRDALCLLNGRFRVEVEWRNQFDGTSGKGSAVGLSGVTGAFYFTDASNLELLVKLLQFPDRVAVFYGTLSNLEYTIRITELATGAVKTYHNEPGSYCGGLDNAAF